ncbi:MAG: potassium-transporting ATPase subunit KdpC [Legionellaceae bacterium]|nr:potassium-transporting ATPase subunit KdpC [Legionellaceae bacterium]
MQQVKIAFVLMMILTALTGFVYPMFVTAIAHVCFPWQANGSLIEQQGKMIGSQWIGQSFSSMDYFWGRPSATTLYPYNGIASSGSNSGPSNPIFLATVHERVHQLRETGRHMNALVPVDMVTASGSGLDPEISPAAAFYQVPRLAIARGLSEEVIKRLIRTQIQSRTYGFLGEPRVNVLQLNRALDKLGNPHV